MMCHTYNLLAMSLPSINLLHLMVSEILPGQIFKGQGHYGRIKSQIKVILLHCTPTTPKQCPYQVLPSYTLQFPRYSPDKILKVKVTAAISKVTSRSHHYFAHLQPPTNVPTARSEVKSRSHHDVAQLHLLTNVPTKYQLPTPYGFRDIAWTRFYRSSSLQQGQRSSRGHTMTFHTYNP